MKGRTAGPARTVEFGGFATPSQGCRTAPDGAHPRSHANRNLAQPAERRRQARAVRPGARPRRPRPPPRGVVPADRRPELPAARRADRRARRAGGAARPHRLGQAAPHSGPGRAPAGRHGGALPQLCRRHLGRRVRCPVRASLPVLPRGRDRPVRAAAEAALPAGAVPGAVRGAAAPAVAGAATVAAAAVQPRPPARGRAGAPVAAQRPAAGPRRARQRRRVRPHPGQLAVQPRERAARLRPGRRGLLSRRRPRAVRRPGAAARAAGGRPRLVHGGKEPGARDRGAGAAAGAAAGARLGRQRRPRRHGVGDDGARRRPRRAVRPASAHPRRRGDRAAEPRLGDGLHAAARTVRARPDRGRGVRPARGRGRRGRRARDGARRRDRPVGREHPGGGGRGGRPAARRPGAGPPARHGRGAPTSCAAGRWRRRPTGSSRRCCGSLHDQARGAAPRPRQRRSLCNPMVSKGLRPLVGSRGKAPGTDGALFGCSAAPHRWTVRPRAAPARRRTPRPPSAPRPALRHAARWRGRRSHSRR